MITKILNVNFSTMKMNIWSVLYVIIEPNTMHVILITHQVYLNWPFSMPVPYALVVKPTDTILYCTAHNIVNIHKYLVIEHCKILW